MAAELILLLLLLSAVARYQFFRGRKLNLMIMKKISGELEDALAPLDKEYTWLGGYVGFKAKYALEKGEAEVTLTLLPRQALLYLPFSLLINRGDRLYLILRGNIDLEETHVFGRKKMLSRGERKELKGLELKTYEGFLFSGPESQASEMIKALKLDNKTLHHLYAKKGYVFLLANPLGEMDIKAFSSYLM
jgi:hypothetical protein